jgi:hypothetical protein
MTNTDIKFDAALSHVMFCDETGAEMGLVCVEDAKDRAIEESILGKCAIQLRDPTSDELLFTVRALVFVAKGEWSKAADQLICNAAGIADMVAPARKRADQPRVVVKAANVEFCDAGHPITDGTCPRCGAENGDECKGA